MSNTKNQPAVSYDIAGPMLHLNQLTIAHPAVTTEALRWSTGRRGDAVVEADLVGVDLRAFAEQALVIGAQAITAAGGSQDVANLEALVNQLGERASRSATDAEKGTRAAVENAGQTVAKAATEAREAIDQAGAKARSAFTQEVAAARTSLESEITRLVGGQNPELTVRLGALLDTFGKDLEARSTKQITEVVAGATKKLDPADPTSPLARQQAELRRQSKDLADAVTASHKELAQDVRELAALVREQQAAAKTKAALASITPLKGADYEQDICAALEQLAAAMGAEFTPTGASVGSVPNSKKGDGVLTLKGGAAKVVIEMHDGAGRRDWNAYLADAERNREAVASLGLVPHRDHNAGHVVRVLGPRRLVLAYAPGDDPAILRATVQLVELVALAAVSRSTTTDLAIAEQRITEAVATLQKIATIRSDAGSIRKSADRIDRDAESLDTALRRLLDQTKSAIQGAQIQGAKVGEAVGRTMGIDVA